MPAGAVVRARVDENVKNEAAAVLAAIGLTVSDAFRMLLVRTATEKALPFDPLVPNETTIAAIREARAGNLPQFTSTDELMDYLDADD
ncbi:MAG: type II toxin-antitoxin system RelB/DinJ family antitoxin [Propionibacteriaceae bacterium]|nr:type II toxin-antitoxin system RelB/DinJ family antitoxin [Propionibacteriaceae bacterium]